MLLPYSTLEIMGLLTDIHVAVARGGRYLQSYKQSEQIGPVLSRGLRQNGRDKLKGR
jgi:hypothetical protein